MSACPLPIPTPVLLLDWRGLDRVRRPLTEQEKVTRDLQRPAQLDERRKIDRLLALFDASHGARVDAHPGGERPSSHLPLAPPVPNALAHLAHQQGLASRFFLRRELHTPDIARAANNCSGAR